MGFPLAVAPSVRSPGLSLSVNLLAATTSPGSAALRAVILACLTASVGTITPDTQLVQGLAGPDDVSTLLGPGSPGHLCAKALFAEYGLAQVDLVAPAEAAGVAATSTITFDATSPVTVAQTVDAEIAGRVIEIVWNAGESAITGATRLVAAVNAASSDLPVLAANGGGASAVVTFTAKQKGTWGNDILVYLTVKDGAGGSVTSSGNLGSVVAGTTEASVVNALTTIAGKEYDLIINAATGNTDNDLASATSAAGRIKTHINTYGSGANAHLQQAIFGVTGTLSAAKTGTAQHDCPEFEYIFCNKGRSLGAEWAGAEAGRILRMEAIDPAVNAINTVFQATLYGARDLVADSLTAAQVEDALQSGITPVTYTAAAEPRVSRPITTYFKDASGNADGRILDRSGVSGVFAVAKDLRSAIPAEFPNKKLSADLEPGDDELPEGVVEVRDVKGFIISRLRFWQKRGVVRRDKLDQVIADGTLVVRVDPSDESQCDMVVPLAIFKPLAKFSLVVQKIA